MNALSSCPTASHSDDTFTVADLSVQPDGADFLVGNTANGGFYQFPAEGVTILDWLREGLTPAMIKARLLETNDPNETIDVDDFVATLVEIGFALPLGVSASEKPEPASDRRWLFAVDRRIAAKFFSVPVIAAYLALLTAAIVCAIRIPAARPSLHAFFIDDNFAATLVLLLVLSSLGTALHEFGHLLAAAREGVSSKLGVGNRLWNIVVEADLSGIMALPKRKRYLPLLAGMLVDLMTIAVTTLAIGWMATHGMSPFLIALLQALVLQTLITMSWQFNIFLRTDIYYVVSTWASYPDLDADARAYLRNKLAFLRKGRATPAEAATPRSRTRMLHAFVVIWVFGRVVALGTLLLIVLPTLAFYLSKAWRLINDPAASGAKQFDASLFAIISLVLVAVGMFVWLRPKFQRLAGKSAVQERIG